MHRLMGPDTVPMKTKARTEVKVKTYAAGRAPNLSITYPHTGTRKLVKMMAIAQSEDSQMREKAVSLSLQSLVEISITEPFFK